MKKEITPEQCISDIRALFNLDKEGTLSKEDKGIFLIDKREFERFDTILKLQEYFDDKMLIPGWCVCIEPITLLFTTFSVTPIDKIKNRQ